MLSSKKHYRRSFLAALAFVLALLISTSTPQAQSNGNPGVIPPNARPYGLTYGQWSAKFWQWSLGLPVEGHPQLGCPESLDAGQSGPVWFLSAVGGKAECAGTVPAGKALFIGPGSTECSDLEGLGATEQEQRDCAQFFTNHIVVSSLFCEIDGVPVRNLAKYRFVSPQFTFTAPTPWLFGAVGGTGTAVSDGYWLMLTPLSRGAHTIHWGSTFHFSTAEGDPFDGDFGADTTYHLTVQP